MSQAQSRPTPENLAAALPALESRFATFFHACPVALHVSRLDTGTIIDCNEAAAHLLGYRREELIGHTAVELGVLREEDRSAVLAAQQEGRTRDMPLTLTCKSGERKRCLISGTVVDADGECCLLVSTVDITARERSEREHAFLAALIESSFDGIVYRDTNGNITGWNAAAERILGYSAAEAIGKHISFMVPPSVWQQFQDHHSRLQRGVPIIGGETQRLAKDGRLVDLAYNTFPVRNERGESLGVATIARDISDRKRIEAALRSSEERYRFLTESMKDVVWACDVETMRFTYVSPSITKMLGWTREEFLTTPALAYFTAESAQKALRTMERGISELSAAAEEQLAGRRYYTEELEALHKDGSHVWLEVIAFLYRDENSGQLELHGVSRDIGERKYAEAALRASERRLQLAARAAGLGIWQWNFADDSLEWDERMCEIYGVPQAERKTEYEYAAWRARVHPEDYARAEAASRADLGTAPEWDRSFRIVLPDGCIRYIRSASVIEPDDAGAPLRMVGINQDITLQKTHERLLEDANAELERLVAARTMELRATVDELQRANAGKDAFLTAISHELRTPLMGVLGMAELLRAEVRGPLNCEQARYAAAIDESGRRLLGIVNNLLLYTHLMSGSAPIERQVCDLTGLCAAAVNAVTPQAERKRQRISQVINPFDITIVSDPRSVVLILRLLLDNAVKFTPDGGRIQVTVEAGPGANTVQIAVADTGIGMTPEQVGGLFRPFAQADNSLTRRFEGMGIGLAIVHKTVELLGGTISVESEPGQGSRFLVILPQGGE